MAESPLKMCPHIIVRASFPLQLLCSLTLSTFSFIHSFIHCLPLPDKLQTRFLQRKVCVTYALISIFSRDSPQHISEGPAGEAICFSGSSYNPLLH